MALADWIDDAVSAKFGSTSLQALYHRAKFGTIGFWSAAATTPLWIS
jgi:hypothetical protein